LKKNYITRTKERQFALQLLFAAEFNNDLILDQLERLSANSKIKPTPYVTKLISLYEKYKEDVDKVIAQKLDNWEINRVAIIDKILLRMAIIELLHFKDIPAEVSINEAIELAKKFSTPYSGKFINGVLDAVYHKLKSEEKILKEEHGLLSQLDDS
jgi:N utilization substance protein B